MRLIIVFSVSILFLACNQKAGDKSRLISEEEQEVQVETTMENERFISVEIDDFNKTLTSIKKDLSAKDVMRLFYPHRVENSQGKEEITIEETTMDNGNSLLVLIHDNLMDDSVKGEKYLMELTRLDSTWKVLSMKKNWKCYEGRGHTNWDTEFCL